MRLETAEAKRNKYGNRQAAGGADSRKEGRRAQALFLLERAGEIRNLQRHRRFELIPAQYDAAGELVERPCHYEADFTYEERGPDGAWAMVVEDVKAKVRVVPGQQKPRYTGRTPEYIIKRKLMLHVLGIRIREIE